jgi:hypothetical protein
MGTGRDTNKGALPETGTNSFEIDCVGCYLGILDIARRLSAGKPEQAAPREADPDGA